VARRPSSRSHALSLTSGCTSAGASLETGLCHISGTTVASWASWVASQMASMRSVASVALGFTVRSHARVFTRVTFEEAALKDEQSQLRRRQLQCDFQSNLEMNCSAEIAHMSSLSFSEDFVAARHKPRACL